MGFDPNTGAPQFGPSPVYPSKPGSGQDQMPMILAIILVITGVMSLVSCMCCLLWPLPVVPLATGIPVLFMRAESTPKTIAIVGIVLACVSVLLLILALVLNIGGAMIAPQFKQQFNQP